MAVEDARGGDSQEQEEDGVGKDEFVLEALAPRTLAARILARRHKMDRM